MIQMSDSGPEGPMPRREVRRQKSEIRGRTFAAANPSFGGSEDRGRTPENVQLRKLSRAGAQRSTSLRAVWLFEPEANIQVQRAAAFAEPTASQGGQGT